MSWTPLIVTVAPNGARRTKNDHPRLPLSPAELADTASECLAAGAAMIHLHVRDREGRHLLDVDAYRAAIAAVRNAVGANLVIQVTTEAVGRYSSAEQMALVRALRPEAVSLALREVVPEGADESAATEFLAWLAGEPILPQFILYSADDLRRYQDLRSRGVISGQGHSLLFVLGRYVDGQQADARELLPFIWAHDDDTPWAVCAFGSREHACCVAGAAFGGDVRVGFENNLALRDGSPAPDNAALVRQIREAADALGRPLADAEDVRAMLEGGGQR